MGPRDQTWVVGLVADSFTMIHHASSVIISLLAEVVVRGCAAQRLAPFSQGCWSVLIFHCGWVCSWGVEKTFHLWYTQCPVHI